MFIRIQLNACSLYVMHVKDRFYETMDGKFNRKTLPFSSRKVSCKFYSKIILSLPLHTKLNLRKTFMTLSWFALGDEEGKS